MKRAWLLIQVESYLQKNALIFRNVPDNLESQLLSIAAVRSSGLTAPSRLSMCGIGPELTYPGLPRDPYMSRSQYLALTVGSIAEA